jgi:hypothetical protein
MSYFTSNADNHDSVSISPDHIVLTIGIGSGKGEINYSHSMQGGGEGPEAFTVTMDHTIYIVDNVNKRVNIYRDGKFIDSIDTPYIVYIRSIVVSQEMIYLMDYDTGKIYKIDVKGTIAEEITIPEDMESYFMRKLYVREDGGVWLYYENNNSSNSSRGTNYSYLVSDLMSDQKICMEGFTKDGDHIYTVAERELNSASIHSNSDIKITTNELLGDLKILDVDENHCLYIDLYEQIDASIVTGEYTVRKYADDKCLGITSIDLGEYYFMPNNVLDVCKNGDLYQMKCLADKIQMVKKDFVTVENFKSSIPEIKEKALEADLINSSDYTAAVTINAPNTQYDTMVNAMNCCLLSWTYTANNAINPNPATVTTPDYLSSASKPSSQTGIPYCWGGFDGLNTHSSSSWTNFSNAMSNNIFAGNVNTSTTGWQSGTAGFDCSGFVSSVAGFSSKLSTGNLASSTYTASVNLSDRVIYDIYVKSGTHVLYYIEDTTDGINTREATTTGDDKTKFYSRSTTWLSGYSLRRFHGW